MWTISRSISMSAICAAILAGLMNLSNRIPNLIGSMKDIPINHKQRLPFADPRREHKHPCFLRYLTRSS